MKKILSIVSVLLIPFCMAAKDYEDSDIFASLNKSDKIAILMVHFGTSHEQTRLLTIDAINKKVTQKYPGVEIREAYTSRIIAKRIREKKGINKQTPLQALMQLHIEGYTHVLVQSTTLIDGSEMLSLQKDVDRMSEYFKDIRVGTPLLYSQDDYQAVIKILTRNIDPKTAYVWVGHGTSYANTAQYAMVAYMLQADGYRNCFMGTIEGYPTFDNMLSQLKASSLKRVALVPFMFVAGEHANNDIAREWKGKLEKEGFSVSVLMEGLGQNPDIQGLYLSHLEFITKHKRLDIMQKKAIYEVTGEKMEE